MRDPTNILDLFIVVITVRLLLITINFIGSIVFS
jgi:hypothetical protein